MNITKTHQNIPSSVAGKCVTTFVVFILFAWALFVFINSFSGIKDTIRNLLSTGRFNAFVICTGFLLICLIACVIWYFPFLSHKVQRSEFYVTIGIFSLMIFFSRTFIEILLFFWLIVLAHSIGRKVLYFLEKAKRDISLEQFVFPTGIGLGVFSIGVFFMGLVGLIYDSLFYGILIIVTIALKNEIYLLFTKLILFYKSIGNTNTYQKRDLFSKALLLVLFCFGVMNFSGALGPEIMYDSLSYYLAFAKSYVDSHNLIERIPLQHFSYWPKNMEMLFTLGLLLKGQILAKLFEFFFGILTAIAIYCFCREFYSKRIGLLASAFFYTCPYVAWESATTYIDLGLTFYCFLAFYACLKFTSSREMYWLIICGILLGVGFGVKLHAVFTFVTVLLVISFFVFLIQMGISKSIKIISLFCIITFLISLPWYLRSYILTGNPIFPFFNSIFQSPFWLKNNEVLDNANFGMGKGFFDYLKLPWNVTFHGNRFGGNWQSGIAFLMFAPLLFWKKIGAWIVAGRQRTLCSLDQRGKTSLSTIQNDRAGTRPATTFLPTASALSIRKLLLFYAFIYSLCWAFSAQVFRYYIPILPVVSIICASSIDYFQNLLRKKWFVLNVLLSLLVLLALYVNIPSSLLTFWNIPTRIPYKVVFGLESWDNYLSNVFADYKAIKYINDSLNPDARIFSLVDHNSFYCERPLIRNQNPFFMSEFSKATNDRNKLLKFFKKDAFTHILINKQAGETGWYNGLLSNNDLHLLYAYRNVYLYKILSPKERIIKMVKTRHSQNLLKNASFEEHQGENVEGWQRHGKPILDSSSTHSYNGKYAVFANVDDVYTQTIPVTPGKTYTLSHYSKTGTNVRGIYGRVQINWHAQDGKMIDASIFVYETSRNYLENSMSTTVPEGVATGTIYVTSHGKDSIWFDDFSFVKEANLK